MVAKLFFKLFIGLHVAIFRLTNGRAMARFRGQPILLLNTVGRKTGKRRTTPLMYMREGESYVIGASNNGSDKHTAWFYNLQDAPEVTIEVPGRGLTAPVAVASPEERERLWPRLVAQAPFSDGYQNGTARLSH